MKLKLHVELIGPNSGMDFADLADTVVRRGKRPFWMLLPDGSEVEANLLQVEVPNE